MTKKILKTEKMPSGAQQYVRGKKASDKMNTLNSANTSLKASHMNNKAFIDVFDKSHPKIAAKRKKEAAELKRKNSRKNSGK